MIRSSNPIFGWNPWEDLRRLQTEFFGGDRGKARQTAAYPPLKAWSDDDALVLRAELPGFDPDSIDLRVQVDRLTLEGRRVRQEAGEGERWTRTERGSGAFRRELKLPFEVDANGVEATFEDGVLELRLPRAESERSRRIPVQAHTA